MTKEELIKDLEKEIDTLQKDFLNAKNDTERLRAVTRRNAISDTLRKIKQLKEA